MSENVRKVVPWPLRWRLPAERPMYLIVGRRGSGKTLLATEIAQARMKRGERVYANYELELVKRVRGGFVPVARAGRIYSLLDCMELSDCTVVIDEAGIWTNSRQWALIPPHVLSSWTQSRKRKVNFIFTSVHEERVDKVVRELVDWLLLCERSFLVPKWVPLFRVQWTYLEQVTEVRRGLVSRAEYRWVPDRAFAGFSTHEDVDASQLEAISAYLAAVKEGKDPGALGLSLPPRREPCRIDPDTGDVSPWEDGAALCEPADLLEEDAACE